MYFGGGFKTSKFPSKSEDIEKVSKERIETILNASARETKKAEYIKGRDSFELLGRVNPWKVRERSKWAARFLDLLKEKMVKVHGEI
jgi:hypothetical protein